MNKLAQILKLIADTPPLMYFLGTLLAFVSLLIFAGFKVACLALAIWLVILMIGYTFTKYS